jgi:hypothetical protein
VSASIHSLGGRTRATGPWSAMPMSVWPSPPREQNVPLGDCPRCQLIPGFEIRAGVKLE